jgi:hypothetical protein
MIGFILIALSWALLKLEGRGLSSLGFNQPKQRVIELSLGFAYACFFVTVQFVLTALFLDFNWILNPELALTGFINSLRWIINSVLYEELVFRGYLLYQAIKLIGARKAALLSACAFGVYHWFSYELWGDVVSMVYVFLLTGAMGLLLAYAFIKTRSIVLPVAIHLGWNVMTIGVFSQGVLGSQILVPDSTSTLLMDPWQQVLVSVVIPLCFVILGMFLLYRFNKFKLTGHRTQAK